MQVSLPKKAFLPTIFKPTRNRIYIDGKPLDLGGNILLVYRIIRRYGVNLTDDPLDPDYLQGEVSGGAEYWVRAAASNDPILLGRAIGRFSDYVLLSRDGKEPIEEGGTVRTAFAAPVGDGKATSFLYSWISKCALDGGPPECLEDYIWLAEHYEAPQEVSMNHVEVWLRELNEQYERPYHLLLTPRGVRRLTDMYIAAVLERLSMHYQIRDVVASMPLIGDAGEAPVAYKTALRWLDSAKHL